MIKDIAIFILFIVLLVWNIMVGAGVSSPDRTYNNPSLKVTVCNSFKCLKDLFDGRNLFGIALSFIIACSSIPGFIFALLVGFIFDFCALLVFIWKLGNKKES